MPSTKPNTIEGMQALTNSINSKLDNVDATMQPLFAQQAFVFAMQGEDEASLDYLHKLTPEMLSKVETTAQKLAVKAAALRGHKPLKVVSK